MCKPPQVSLWGFVFSENLCSMHAEKEILQLGCDAGQGASQAEAGCIHCKNGDIVSGLAATEKSRVCPDVSIAARAGRKSWRDL